jgi:predicted metal-dependent peptidase
MKVPTKLIEAFDKLFLQRPMATIVAGSWKLVENPGIPSIGVDGVSLHYNREFLNKWVTKDLAWILMHETLHCFFGHHVWFSMKKKRMEKDMGRPMTSGEHSALHEVLNIASDMAINGLPSMMTNASPELTQYGYFPGTHPYGDFPAGLSADDYYELLVKKHAPPPPPPPQQPPPEQEEPKGDEEGDDGKEEDLGGDGESKPDPEKSEDSKDQGKGDSGAGEDGGEDDPARESPGGPGQEGETGDESEGSGSEGSESGGEGEGKSRPKSQIEQVADAMHEAGIKSNPNTGEVMPAPAPTDDALEKATRDWHTQAEAAAAAEISRGTAPGWMKQFADSLTPIPKVDWRTMLRRYLQSVCRVGRTYARPSRRGHFCSCIMPAVGGVGSGEIAILTDTSGSMDEGQMNVALSATSEIVAQLPGAIKVRIYQADTRLIEDATREFTRDDFPIRIPHEWFGRGGTNLSQAVLKIAETRPKVLLIVSDMFWGYMNTPAISIPTVWLTTSIKVDEVPFGFVVHMMDEKE